MRIRGSKFLYRLLLFGLLLGTLPTVTIGILSAYKASDTIRDKVNQANSQIVNQIELQVEQILQAADSSTIQLLATMPMDELLGRPYGNSFEDGVYFNDVVRAINRIRTLDISNEVSLVSLERDWILNNTGFVFEPTDDWRTKEALIDRIVGGTENSLWSSDAGQLILAKRVPFYSPSPKGILLLTMPIGEISKLITQNKELGSLMIVDEEGRVVMNQFQIPPREDLSSLDFVRTIRESDALTGSFVSRYDGRDAGIVYRKSPYSRWTYVSVMDIASINRDSSAIVWYVVKFVLGILLVTVAIIWIGSNQMYNPLRKLYKTIRAPEAQGPDGAVKDEIQFIGERFQSLMSSQVQMNQQLKEFFVMKLFQGEAKAKEVRAKLESFGFPADWRRYGVLVVQIDSLDETRYEEKDLDLLLFAINNIVGEIIDGSATLVPIVTGNSQATLIGGRNDEEEFKKELYDAAVKVQESVGAFLKLKISVGISRIHRELLDAHKAYREGIEVLKFKDRLGEAALLRMEDIQPHQGALSRYPKELETQFLDALRIVDHAQAEELLSELLSKLFSIPLQHYEYQLIFMQLLIEINRLMQERGMSLQEVYKDETSMAERLFHMSRTTEIESWFRESIVQPVLRMLDKKMKTQFSSISEEVKRMIDREFDSDLTLEACAARMNYNPVYVGRIFRKETGMTFSEYLSNRRLEAAKTWLRDTDQTVAHIADKLKYNSATNFIRYFRNKEGITPGQYRERHGGKRS